ncbi:hypothetical protein ACWAU3_19435 [Shewanella sp. JL219SE-S6]
MCNDKLIGVRSYPEITDSYDDEEVFGPTPPPKNGEDYGGHGSHTASTAAGNILKNVPYVAGEVGEAQGDGIETGLKFTQISGVAPMPTLLPIRSAVRATMAIDIQVVPHRRFSKRWMMPLPTVWM